VAAPPPERALVTLRGLLHVAGVRRGTASEQPALTLDAGPKGRYVLIKRGGPSFGLPPEASRAGQHVEATGYLLGRELRYVDVRAVDRQ
jgi:hypothetical protein